MRTNLLVLPSWESLVVVGGQALASIRRPVRHTPTYTPLCHNNVHKLISISVRFLARWLI